MIKGGEGGKRGVKWVLKRCKVATKFPGLIFLLFTCVCIYLSLYRVSCIVFIRYVE